MLLDLGLEGGSGLDVLDRVRAADGLATRIDPDLPVIVLTGRAAEADRVRSFERGADDHVSKPFLYAELLARIRAVLSRADGRRGARGVAGARPDDRPGDPDRAAGGAAGSSCRRRSSRCSTRSRSSPSASTPSRSCCATSGATSSAGNTRTLDAHACRLRKKLRPSSRAWVVNVRGVGYKLTEAL